MYVDTSHAVRALLPIFYFFIDFRFAERRCFLSVEQYEWWALVV